jgi:hypothetical protein
MRAFLKALIDKNTIITQQLINYNSKSTPKIDDIVLLLSRKIKNTFQNIA